MRFIVLTLVLVACGSATSKHSARPLANARVPASPAAEQLLGAVDELSVAEERRDHTRVLAALEALANALTEVAPLQTSEILRVRTSGAALSRSVDNATARADFVRIGLAAAEDAFAAVGPHGDRDRYKSALAAMHDAIAEIQPDRDLADEYPKVAASLRAAVRVVYAAEYAAEPTLNGARVAGR